MSADETLSPAQERFVQAMQAREPGYQLPVTTTTVMGQQVQVRAGSAIASSSAAKAGVNQGETGERTTRVLAVAVEPTDDIAGWERAHMAIMNANGWLNRKSFNPKALSGYVLPDIIADSEGGTYYTPDVIATLAAARVAEITQAQLETFLKCQALLDGYTLKGG